MDAVGVDIAIEASGVFTDAEDARRHRDAGAGRVLVTAPSDGSDITICMGVNETDYDPDEDFIVSNASCTTNCLAPVARVLDETFGIETGFLTTVHSVTGSQSLTDTPASKTRRGRSALTSIVPTTTGAAIATTEVLPQLEGRMDGLAMRVPTPDGSIIDFVARLGESITKDTVNDAFREAADTGRLRGILGITDDDIVSADIIGTAWSALVDAQSTMVLQEDTVKVLALYDNEWGYSRRVVDLADYMLDQT